MVKIQMSHYAIMSKQIPVAREIIKMIKTGRSFNEIVAKFLPEYIYADGECLLEIKTRKELKSSYRWSDNFDGNMYIPLHERDLLFTVLYELDKKENPDLVGKKISHVKRSCNLDEIQYYSTKVATLNNAIEFINQSNLDQPAKSRMINEFKKSLKI